jgi:hypothetical protein
MWTIEPGKVLVQIVQDDSRCWKIEHIEDMLCEQWTEPSVVTEAHVFTILSSRKCLIKWRFYMLLNKLE